MFNYTKTKYEVLLKTQYEIYNFNKNMGDFQENKGFTDANNEFESIEECLKVFFDNKEKWLKWEKNNIGSKVIVNQLTENWECDDDGEHELISTDTKKILEFDITDYRKH